MDNDTSNANQRSLDDNINRILESYRRLLKRAIVEDNHQPYDELEILSAASKLVSDNIFVFEIYQLLILLTEILSSDASCRIDFGIHRSREDAFSA